MNIKIKSRVYSPSEYLEMEASADQKHEYWSGEIITMTGGSLNHNDIAGNLYAHLKFSLRHQPYKVCIGDVRLWIPRYELFTYPDVMLVSGQPNFYPERTDTITNPQLIIEVLSKNTRNYDQGDKFDAYRTIPQFKEYILVDQYQVHIKQFIKNSEGYWLLKEYREPEQLLKFASVDFTLSLDEVYEGVSMTEKKE